MEHTDIEKDCQCFSCRVNRGTQKEEENLAANAEVGRIMRLHKNRASLDRVIQFIRSIIHLSPDIWAEAEAALACATVTTEEESVIASMRSAYFELRQQCIRANVIADTPFDRATGNECFSALLVQAEARVAAAEERARRAERELATIVSFAKTA